ncbi:MAG: alanine or glycine:cation symporter, family [Bacillota bacterium]|jgi:AGCS family alanine or glycine:cation symporter|nr:alanine or glycine:cation symporter, family [Bacillota bacterium]MDK2856456.1 alanine or glycine:cation symporter, family [Bacillota bacterium]MDK2926042.1 alanine or glycine:cation symporter, family [Bacillota bacterium]
MEWIMALNSKVNAIVWGPPMLVLLVGTGIYLTIRQGWPQVSKFGYAMRHTLGKLREKGEGKKGEVTPFQALATAMAGTVGTGNIAGVATAIAIGGPGAAFWMWLSAFFGMCTKYSEVILAVHYREVRSDGTILGGPFQYIEKGLQAKWLAVLFALFGGLASFGIGNMTQANSVAHALETSFGVPRLASGIVMMVITGIVILGGLKSIVKVTEKLVPFMAIFYILGGIALIIMNIGKLPAALALIFKEAFTGTAAVGGFAGSTVMLAVTKGVARGVFSNEAGLGSAPIVHATARVDHPVQQGLWGIFEVFMDTLVICSITALSIVMTGAWQTGKSGAELTMIAFNQAIPHFGTFVVSIGLALFAYSTILSWQYYGEKCWEYLGGPGVRLPYRILFLPPIVLGSLGALNFIWDLADTLNGLMAIPNLIALLGLSPVIAKLTREYFIEKA